MTHQATDSQRCDAIISYQQLFRDGSGPTLTENWRLKFVNAGFSLLSNLNFANPAIKWSSIMQELTVEDLKLVSGGVERQYDIVPNAQSDWGNRLNDASNMLGNFGGWLGRSIYDATH